MLPKPRTSTVLLLLMLLMPSATARAQPPSNVVTACQNAQQPGLENLFEVVARSARPDARPVVFDCPPDTVIQINPDAALRIGGPVVIDGQNKITLDAPGQRDSVFTVPGGIGASLTLRNLKIRGAQRSTLAAASVVFSHEPLILENVTIEGSEFPIRVLNDLTVRNSRFTGNTGTVLMIGDTSREGGVVLIENTRFIANAGPAINGGRTTTVRTSQFVGNESGVHLVGGSITGTLFQSNTAVAIVMGGRSETELRGNTFDKNGTGVLVFAGGAGIAVRVRVVRNLFTGHTTGAIVVTEFGTAKPPPGSRLAFELLHNRFLRNSTEQNGGGVNAMLRDMAPLVSMQTRGNVFRDNVAKGDGGAIHWAGGSLAIAHSVFRGNRASTGSAVFARTPPGAAVTIANTLVVESGGAAIDVPAATIVNTTIARNQGRAVVFADAAAAGAIANTIFDQNGGGNCVGVAAGIVRRGNIQFGAADCPGVTVANPNLDALFVPAFGSAATEIGDGAVCSAAPVEGVDLLLQRRGRQRCSSGAYERPPVRAAAATPLTGELCADGTRVRPGQPCAAALMICPGGQSVPFGATCPCQPHGLTCSTSSECCNGVPCTSGRCRFP